MSRIFDKDWGAYSVTRSWPENGGSNPCRQQLWVYKATDRPLSGN
jgi:hypothetical protein